MILFYFYYQIMYSLQMKSNFAPSVHFTEIAYLEVFFYICYKILLFVNLLRVLLVDSYS